MADDPKNAAPAASSPPAAAPAQKQLDAQKPADTSGGVAVTIERDYWPKSQPKQDNPMAVQENRVRAGETVTLPTDEAMDVIEAGIGKRARGA